jgi:uncharacterized protein DUF5989
MTLAKKGKFRRGMRVLASAPASIVDFVRGLWNSRGSKRWLVPLVVFLCATGLLLILAATVEAVAPFIYSIF